MSVWSFRSIAMAVCVMLGGTASALAAEYRDPKNIFGLTFDENVWSLDVDADGEFGVQCAPGACLGAVAGCSLSKQHVPSGSVARIMKSFDGESIAREQMAAFAAQKAELEEALADRVTWDPAAEVAPEIVQPYTPRDLAGHPVLQAEFRMSMAGKMARYVSYMTAAGSYSIAVVCHATEADIDAWRPRFETLMASFRPGPRARAGR